MTETAQRESAKIYQFPTRERVNRADRQRSEHAATRLPQVEFGSGWYHDAAVQEAEQKPRRHPR